MIKVKLKEEKKNKNGETQVSHVEWGVLEVNTND